MVSPLTVWSLGAAFLAAEDEAVPQTYTMTAQLVYDALRDRVIAQGEEGNYTRPTTVYLAGQWKTAYPDADLNTCTDKVAMDYTMGMYGFDKSGNTSAFDWGSLHLQGVTLDGDEREAGALDDPGSGHWVITNLGPLLELNQHITTLRSE